MEIIFNTLKLSNINKLWPIVTKMLEKVLKHTYKEETLESVRNAVLAEDISIVIMYENNIAKGLFTINDYEGILYVPHTYIEPGSSKDLLRYIDIEIIKIAKTLKCKQVKAFSNRKGMTRRLEGLGWKQGYIEYIKEI